MTITYHGHSCFRLKGKKGVVVTDPYDDYIGLKMPNLTADIVTVSHDHKDHNKIERVKPSDRREKVFVINHPGEYEVGGISVFGVSTYHDVHGGVERGKNNIFTIIIDGVRVCHLGDLGHLLSQEEAAQIGMVDVLFLPVGGVYTIDPEQAVKVAKFLEPGIVIPMHFKTPAHDEKVFADLATLEDFIKVYDSQPGVEKKLNVEKDRLPEEMELVVLERS
ncbi:MAG: MBL fold metallo-hydrolase [Candidatus Woesebacteria bacterium]